MYFLLPTLADALMSHHIWNHILKSSQKKSQTVIKMRSPIRQYEVIYSNSHKPRLKSAFYTPSIKLISLCLSLLISKLKIII